MQHAQFSLFFGICTCCWPTLAWNRHTSPNEYMHLEQEAKMSSLVWICYHLNSSHNQRVVATLDLEYRHCTKSLPRRLGSHYSWMKWSWGTHCACFFLKSHQLASDPLVNSVWGKYNWQTNASMTLMGASDRCSARAVKVPVLCHCLGQVLPTLLKKSAFPYHQIVQWRISLIVYGNQGEMQPSLHPKHCRLGQVVFLCFLSTPVTKTCIPAEVWVMPNC